MLPYIRACGNLDCICHQPSKEECCQKCACVYKDDPLYNPNCSCHSPSKDSTEWEGRHKRNGLLIPPVGDSTVVWEERFRNMFSIKVSPLNEDDKTKAFLLEKYWQEHPIGEMIDFIRQTLSNQLEEVKRITGSVKKDLSQLFPEMPHLPTEEYARVVEQKNYYNKAIEDVLSLLTSLEIR